MDVDGGDLDRAMDETDLLSTSAKRFHVLGLVGFTGRLVVTSRQVRWLPSTLDALLGARRWELLITDIDGLTVLPGRSVGLRSRGLGGWIPAVEFSSSRGRTRISVGQATKVIDAIHFVQS